MSLKAKLLKIFGTSEQNRIKGTEWLIRSNRGYLILQSKNDECGEKHIQGAVLCERQLIGMDGNFHINYWTDNVSYLNQRSVRLRAKDKSNVSIVQAKYNIQHT